MLKTMIVEPGEVMFWDDANGVQAGIVSAIDIVKDQVNIKPCGGGDVLTINREKLRFHAEREKKTT